MIDSRSYKQLPWPENLWKELYVADGYFKPPEDWEQALKVFTDTLSELEKKILFAWYRDKKTGKQMQEEFGFPGVISKRVDIVNRMRRDRRNYQIYMYGPAKAKLIQPLSRGLKDALGISDMTVNGIINEILTHTTIAEITVIEHKIASLPFGLPENSDTVEMLLNQYGLTMLCTQKYHKLDLHRARILEESLEIIQHRTDRDALLKRISDAFCCFTSNGETDESIYNALFAKNPDSLLRSLIGEDRLGLLCKAGVLKLHQSDGGYYFWGVVQRAETLPPIQEVEL